jgi:sulfur relay (sulfurtransferase) DsrF/TusC family protein
LVYENTETIKRDLKMPNNSLVTIFNKAPYERISIVEGARCIAGVSTMGLEGIAVFIDDGVYALLKNQNPSGAGLEPISVWLRLLETNKVPMKVIRESLAERGIKESDLEKFQNLDVISTRQLSELMANYSSVFVV